MAYLTYYPNICQSYRVQYEKPQAGQQELQLIQCVFVWARVRGRSPEVEEVKPWKYNS
jgi:hypothetical protein